MGRISIRGRNYCRGCGYCQPCPSGIPIPKVLALYNRWEVFNGNNWAQMHNIAHEYKQTVADDQLPDKCINCGACVQRCPFNLPIPELMKQAATMRRY
jgi:predicted aldo/keto reductase-like oxidoreductase